MRNVYTNETLRGAYAGRPALIIGRGQSRLDVPRDDWRAFQRQGGVVWIINKLVMMPEYAEADCLAFLDQNMVRADRGSKFPELPESVRQFRGSVYCPSKWSFNENQSGPVSRIDLETRIRGFEPHNKLYFNRGSALFAFQLAIVAGCNPIWLCGVDQRLCEGERWAHADTFGDCTKQQHRWLAALERQLEDWLPVPAWCEAHGVKAYKTSDYSRLPFDVKPLPVAVCVAGAVE